MHRSLTSLLSIRLLWLAVLAPVSCLRAQASLSGDARIDDIGTASPLHAFGDARGFRAKVVGERIECALEMAKPLLDGMFTMVELSIDCDDKPATGLHGRELRIRAAVGSRFQPSSASASNGGRRPIDHLRISGTSLRPNGSGGQEWIHMWVEADAPVVRGNELHFWFPKRLVRDRGDRYHGRLAMQVWVETSCSEQPIERLHVCNDDGLAIVVDGEAREWSAVSVKDPGGELHEVARCIDLTSLRVDHGRDCLFACVTTAIPGFTAWGLDDDVMGMPMITVMVEPMFPRYQDPYEVLVLGGRSSFQGQVEAGTWLSCASETVVEVQLPRKEGQNRLRVIALADLLLTDLFDRELRLDAEAR